MLMNGTMIAERYEIVDTVGSGGMSVVYKALDHRLNRNVAIKVLKEEFSSDKSFVAKFRVEAQSAAGLSHPNIVNVYDVGETDGIHYIVMELVEGITLKEYIQKKGHLSVSEAVNFSLQIASGIEVAHENHIIHRDIKPQNIIVSPSGILKVTDFGIAKATTSATISSNAVGSVHYISPEQARGGFSDERSDIYSLGITMYEMVTGRVPFEGDNNVTVALMHIQSEMIPPSEYYPDILPSFEKVIAKCTEKKPERRYLTANALVADLRRVEADPSGSFVKTAALPDNAPTRNITDDELKAIKQQSSVIPVADINQALGAEAEGEVNPDAEGDEDDEDGDELDPKMERLAKVLGVVAAVLVVLIVIFFIAYALGAFGGKKKSNSSSSTTEASAEASEDAEELEVIDVVGQDYIDAKKALSDAGFTNVKIEFQEDDDVDEDKVISQTPEAGETVSSDEEIQLLVSSGTEQVSVPDVVNYSSDSAKNLLEQAGFTVNYEYNYDDTIGEDKVISQTPEGNTQAAKGSVVTINVSRGAEVEEIEVPNVIGADLESAESTLANLGLKYSITKAYSDNYEKGEVINQGYSAGEKVTTGTVVPLTVSEGSETTEASVYTGTFSLRDILDESATEGHIQVYQDSSSNPIYDVSLTHSDFPFQISVTGTKPSATITIYLDGTKYSTQNMVLGSAN